MDDESVVDSSDDETDWWDGVYGTPFGVDCDKEEELIDACKDGNVDAVLELIGNDFQKSEVNLDCRVLVNHPNPPVYSRKRRTVMFESSPFHICCELGHEELVQYFINREECNFLTTDMDDLTPLHSAVVNDHLPIVKLLVKSQRVPNMLERKDRTGRTPLYIAAQLGRSDILTFLVKQTFRNKADVDATQNDGSTPLHMACRNGHLECVKILHDKGKANVELSNHKELRPLHAAVLSRSCEIVEFLYKNCAADLNVLDSANRSPFYLAAQNDDFALVKQISQYDGIDMQLGYAYSYTAQETALAKKPQNKEIGFYIRDLQRARDIEKKERIEAANKAMGKKNREGTKKKTLLSEDEWAIAKEFIKGKRNLIALDTINFKSWQDPKLDWVRKEHDVKEMRTKERVDREEREQKARWLEEDLQEQREKNGGLTDAEVREKAMALKNRRKSVSERRKSVSGASKSPEPRRPSVSPLKGAGSRSPVR
jgi:ankyrin repeat protein